MNKLTLLTLPQMAKLVGNAYLTVWNRVQRGEYETIKVGRQHRIVVRDPILLELVAAEEAADAQGK